jgi:hypothetical protein
MSIPAPTHLFACSRHFFSSKLLGPSKSDKISLGVGELRYDKFASRIFCGTHDAPTAEAFGFLKCGFDVANTNVEDCVAVICRPSADSARNPDSIGRRIAIDEPVIAGVRNLFRYRRICVELPSEKRAVVRSKFRSIFPDDLKVHDGIAHDGSPFLAI